MNNIKKKCKPDVVNSPLISMVLLQVVFLGLSVHTWFVVHYQIAVFCAKHHTILKAQIKYVRLHVVQRMLFKSIWFMKYNEIFEKKTFMKLSTSNIDCNAP